MALTKVIGDGTGTIDNLTVADAGTIGSASKTNAITIASSGLVQLTSTGIGAGSQVFQVIDDGATLFQIRSEDGNVSFPQSGAGIYLGVTSGNSANLLDDYEEGTFTAQISTDSTYVGDTAQSGVYTKIGDMCFIQIRFQRTGTLNSGSNARFGVPFTSANNAVQATGFRGSVENIDTSVIGVGGTIAANSAILYLNEMTAATTGHNLNGSDLGENFQVQIQGFYKIA